MANKHLHLEPHHVDQDFWWYEENKGITVVMQLPTKDGGWAQTVRRIPWADIRAALKRKDRKR